MARLDDGAVLDALRARLAEADYTTARIEQTLGGGRISFSPADVAAHARRLPPGEPSSPLVKLFLLGLPLGAAEAATALGPLAPAALEPSG